MEVNSSSPSVAIPAPQTVNIFIVPDHHILRRKPLLSPSSGSGRDAESGKEGGMVREHALTTKGEEQDRAKREEVQNRASVAANKRARTEKGKEG